MYTQCPDCSTVFRVTAEALRAAQGRVRCGICSTGFDALENLSESPVARALDEPSHEDTITVEELPGTEFIELSGASQPGEGEPDDRPAGEEPPAEDGPEGGEPGEPRDAGEGIAEPPADPLDGLTEAALEFHGSTEDLEKLFVPAGPEGPGTEPMDASLPGAIEEVASRDLSGIEVLEEDLSWPDDAGDAFDPANPAHVAAVLASSSGKPGRGEHADLDRTDEYPVLVIEDYEEARPQEAAADAQPPAATQAEPEEASTVPGPGEDDGDVAPGTDAATGPEVAATGTAARDAADEATGDEENAAAQPDGKDANEPLDAAPLLIIPEELRRGPSATAADDLEAPLDLDEEAPRRWPLALAAVLLAAVLGAQAVHHWRQDLVRSPAAGPWMLRAYHALGLELQPPADLARFELRQLGAASDPGQAGRIRVRASIVNQAPFAQPYPLLRLTLQDRFGSTIGARNLAPAEYLPGAAMDASGLLGPSQRADAEVVFVDPGREAVGFELDVCVEAGTGLRCSTDLPRSAP